MCFDSLAWATKQKLPAMQKIVLMMLADHENAETKLCFPSIETLADECGMSERSVSNQIAKLSAAGLIEITRFNHTSNRYVLLKPDAPVALADAPRSEADAPVASKPIINQQINLKDISYSSGGEKSDEFLTTEKADEILTDEQQEVFDWAVVHAYWYTATVSIATFLKVYAHQGGVLKAQFNAHKKARSLSKANGLNSEIIVKNTGGNYASNSKSNQYPHLSAAQIAFRKANGLGEFAPGYNTGNVFESTCTRQ